MSSCTWLLSAWTRYSLTDLVRAARTLL